MNLLDRLVGRIGAAYIFFMLIMALACFINEMGKHLGVPEETRAWLIWIAIALGVIVVRRSERRATGRDQRR
jgi:positive regulator of sigma E activity